VADSSAPVIAVIAYKNQSLIQQSTGKILFQLVVIIENF